MTGTIYQGYIKDDAGNIIEGASVEVRDQDTNAVVTIWSDLATTTTKTNPTTTDANGYFFFYRIAGRHKITVTSATFNATFNNVAIGNAQERDTGTGTGQVPLADDISAVGFDNLYSSLTGLPTLGTMAALDTGTGVSQFRTNTQNQSTFLQIANNLSDVTASAARANLGISGVESLSGVVANNYVPLKRSDAFVDSPITIDANDVISFTGNGPTSFAHDVDVTGEISMTKNQNAQTEFAITNTDTGASAVARFKAVNGTVESSFYAQASSNRAIIGTTSNHSVRIVTNNSTRANFTNTGPITLGSFSTYTDTVTVDGTFRSIGAATFDGAVRVLGDFYAANGTAALPTIRFWDTNGGLYHIGSDIIGMSVVGVERTRFTTTGVDVTGAFTATTTIKPGSYTVATVPSAATAGAGAMIYVSDETGGAVPAFSDGTDWRRVTDRTVIA